MKRLIYSLVYILGFSILSACTSTKSLSTFYRPSLCSATLDQVPAGREIEVRTWAGGTMRGVVLAADSLGVVLAPISQPSDAEPTVVRYNCAQIVEVRWQKIDAVSTAFVMAGLVALGVYIATWEYHGHIAF